MDSDKFKDLLSIKRNLERLDGDPAIQTGIQARINQLIQREADQAAEKLKLFTELREQHGGFVDPSTPHA